MEIEVENVDRATAVTVMKIFGELDSSCYLDVVKRGEALYADGCRNLLLDLSELTFMASSGLISIHNLAFVMRGVHPPNAEAGWGIMYETRYDLLNSKEKEVHLKLLSPPPRIEKTLTMTGFSNFLEIFTDRDEALASFA